MPVPPAGQGSLITLSPIGLPQYSSRNATQTLDVIPAAKNFRRTVNGVLKSLAPSSMRKYKSKITCTDVDNPALDGIWPGTVVTVNCSEELAYLATALPDRPVVSGSSRISGNFIYYRPSLTMLVVDRQASFDEWGGLVSWTLDLEEE